MWRYTTFKIGGNADRLHIVSSLSEMMNVLKANPSAVILGCGSNVLVSDKGIRNDVIITTSLNHVEIDETRVVCECGAKLSNIADKCAEKGLTGLEFATGIPGTIGGAVYMNAGAYNAQMSDVVESVESFQNGKTKVILNVGCQFGYRSSVFQNANCAITKVTLNLQHGDKDLIHQTMHDYQQRRESKQPLEYPSAGSVFKRPTGYYAGTLIEQAGLKGVRVGDAQVSEKHAGFIINTGKATAKDVLDLIQLVQKRVYEVHGVHLTPEIKFLGER